jgi:hypothetical protein
MFLLCMLLQGCWSVGSKVPQTSVEVVKAHQMDWGVALRKDGIELEDVTAIPLAVRLSNSDFSDQDHLKYFYVNNKMILDGLKSKLGTNYLKLLQKYEDVKNRGESPVKYPELGLEYKLRPTIEGISTDEYIGFKLSEAFEGITVIVEVRDKVVSDVWGGFSSVPNVVDLFENPETLVLYRFGKSGFYGFRNIPGGKVFSLILKEDRFKLGSLSASLPALEDVYEIFSVRIDSRLASVLGGSQYVNSTLFIYSDRSARVIKVFVMDRHFVFNETSSRCPVMESAGALPSGMSCFR